MSADPPFQSKTLAGLVGDLLDFLSLGQGSNRALTDLTQGSVARTLTEAFARELAVGYQQLDWIHRQGYLATAEGEGLDNVVALLGVVRRTEGHYQGVVTFRRAAGVAGDIHIPAGTQVAGRDVPPCETTAPLLLADGLPDVQGAVRSVEPAEADGEPEIGAGLLDTLPRPVAGLGGVTNPAALRRSDKTESDEELRGRARRAGVGDGGGTVAAIRAAVRACGIQTVTVEENATPGWIVVRLGDSGIDGALLKRVEAAVERTRPAGIRARVEAAAILPVDVDATLMVRERLDADGAERLRAEVENAVRRYFAGLAMGGGVRVAELRAVLLGPSDVTKVDDGKSRLRPPAGPALSFDGEPSTIPAGPNQRIALGRLAVSLVPPRYAVYLDVTVHTLHEGAATPGRLEADLRARLDEELALPPDKAGTVSWRYLKDVLKPVLGDGASVSFILIHEMHGIARHLSRDGDQDGVTGEEEVVLRNIRMPDHD